MKLQISHTTRYEYDRNVQLHPHLLYLSPRDNPLLKVSHFEITFDPEATLYWMRDDFDNILASAHFSQETETLKIQSRCTVQTIDTQPFDFLMRDYANQFPFDYEPLHRFNLGIYLTPPDSATQKAVKTWLKSHFENPPIDTVSWLLTLNQTIFNRLVYNRRDEPGIQSPLQTIQLGSGTCRDYASLLVACFRTLGLAARFVSGYLFDANQNPTSPGDMHAWTEVFLPGAGWRGLDPTNGLFCDNTYVPVAHAVVAESINPVQGSFYSLEPAHTKLFTEVRIQQTDTAISK